MSTLSGLCTVCYAEQPKYRCPRCKSQTCSLPCYKTHQQRASCNGQRNPATFVKKSEWATSAGIDHDYNYLKTVERQIERADEDVKSRTTKGNVPKKNKNQWQNDSSLQRYMQQNKITIIRAPIGMSRSVGNKTRVTSQGKVFWTVEWIDTEGSRVIDENCPEFSKLFELHAIGKAKQAKLKSQARRTDIEQSSSKRRRTDDAPMAAQPLATLIAAQSVEPALEAVDHSRPQEKSSGRDEVQLAEPLEAAVWFYLHRHSAVPSVTTLIPVESQATLTSALVGRTIHEFPTLYALPYAPSQLPPQFETEETMLARKTEIPTTKERFSAASAIVSQERPQPANPEQILAMLKRDLHTV